MKRLLIVIFILSFSQNVYPLTLGSSIGLGVGQSKVKDFDNNIDFNLSYKILWNSNRFILGTEIFYDFLNVENQFNSDSLNIKYRYGISYNIGYNITYKIAIYGNVGGSFTKYNFNNISNIKDKVDFVLLYGTGVSYELTPKWRVNFEYDIQRIKIHNYFKDNLHSVKLLINYKF